MENLKIALLSSEILYSIEDVVSISGFLKEANYPLICKIKKSLNLIYSLLKFGSRFISSLK